MVYKSWSQRICGNLEKRNVCSLIQLEHKAKSQWDESLSSLLSPDVVWLGWKLEGEEDRMQQVNHGNSRTSVLV